MLMLLCMSAPSGKPDTSQLLPLEPLVRGRWFATAHVEDTPISKHVVFIPVI